MTQYLQAGINALNDPTRVAILQSLAAKPSAVNELAQGFPMSRPAISQHLRILKDAGLVNDEEHGTRRVYHIDPAGMAALKAHFDTLWESVLADFAREAGSPNASASAKEKKHARAPAGRVAHRRK